MKKFLIPFAIIINFFLPQISSACSVCFGMPSDQSISQGLDMAILMLIGVTGTVLGGIATFFIYIVRKARKNKGIVISQESISGSEDSI